MKTAPRRPDRTVSGPKVSDAATLYSKTFAAPTYLVPEMLLAGHLTLIAGRPKSGKTWLVLELAISVALGRKFLDRPIVTPGRVLFCEFDDGEQQLNHRLRLLLPKIRVGQHQRLKNINLVYSLRPLRQGGIRDLAQLLKEARKAGQPYQLLVIDPYMSVRSNGKRRDLVADDYRELGALRQLCMKYQCTGVLVHHLRKGTSPFASDRVLGSTGITAAVDVWWIVMEDRDDPKRKLVEVKGRSIPEAMLRIGFNPIGPRPGFYAIEQGVELKAGPQGGDILRLLRKQGPKQPSEIAKQLSRPPNNVYQILNRLRQRGLLLKEGVKYVYPS